jgi:hypothetical protein
MHFERVFGFREAWLWALSEPDLCLEAHTQGVTSGRVVLAPHGCFVFRRTAQVSNLYQGQCGKPMKAAMRKDKVLIDRSHLAVLPNCRQVEP